MSEKDELNRLVSPNGSDLRQLSSRSGKACRLMTLLEEVIATGEQALVFTQYRRMGRLLSGMIENDLGCGTLFLHGGTPVPRRQKMIDQFQSADGSAPIFILSLKAGGLGLNLTAANHVFHFDRWWNLAVERPTGSGHGPRATGSTYWPHGAMACTSSQSESRHGHGDRRVARRIDYDDRGEDCIGRTHHRAQAIHG